MNKNQKIKTFTSDEFKRCMIGIALLIPFPPLLSMLNSFYDTYLGDLAALSIEIYGAFIATLFGVYISLYYSKKQEKEKDNRIMLGSLKIVWAELDINEDILKHIHSGLKSMPRIATKLYEQQEFLIKHSSGLSSKAFYATMSSGAINVISANDEIFSDLQIAYQNTRLAQNGLILTNDVYKDLVNPTFVQNNQQLVKSVFQILDNEGKKIERTIIMTAQAKKSIFDYLTKKGVTFTREERKKQQKS